MIVINERVAIAEDELAFEFVRSSGPGGQNVNKVATAVRLRFDARGSASLPEDVRARLVRLAGRKIGDDGVLSIHARAHRTQEANRREAVERFIDLLRRACERPTPRRPSRPTRASRERRLEAKRRRGETKQARRGPNVPED